VLEVDGTTAPKYKVQLGESLFCMFGETGVIADPPLAYRAAPVSRVIAYEKLVPFVPAAVAERRM